MASEERDRDMALEWLRECVAIHDDAESPDLPGVRYALALVEATPPQPDAEPMRAMLGEVVADDEELPCGCSDDYWGCDCNESKDSFAEGVAVGRNQMRKEIREILARPRTLASEDGGDRPMKRRHEGRWAMAESLPAPRPHESVSLSNYPLPAGAVVEVRGDGLAPGTLWLKVRPSPHHSWRDVWEGAVRPVEQEELGL